MVKLCKDCKYYSGTVGSDRCYSPHNGMSLISGKCSWNTCSSERSQGWFISRLDNLCGKEGRYFEPKNSDLNKPT